MANLDLSSIASLLSGGGISAISEKVGAKEDQVTSAVTAALPALISGMKQNVSTEAGAASLAGALSDHKNADVSNVTAFLNGADLTDGAKIVSHILGGKEKATTAAIAEKSGLSSSKVSSILSMIAPLLLSLLGKKQEETSSASTSSSLTGLLGSVLGGSGGSSALGSLASSALGELFGSGSSDSAESASGTGKKKKDEKKEDGGLLGGLLGLFK
ncbi:MAG: DUF937 domain-containing protein [Clostridia bacterium]|nr:DUF937 domain-containing protein [Clostridia bacterium]